MAASLGWCTFDTPVGTCGIAWGESSLSGVQLPETDVPAMQARMARRFPGTAQCAPPPWVEAAIARLRGSLAGERDNLCDLPLDMSGLPAFQQRVYVLARAIAPGEVLTYGEMARQLGEPGAARAVGRALGANPFAPVVPCHRILAAGGRAGGFSAEGGALTKLRLLEIEQVRFGSQPGLFDE